MGANRAAKQASRDAETARQEETDRQNRIRSGTASINSTFDREFYGAGGPVGTTAAPVAPVQPLAVETVAGSVDQQAVRAAQRRLDSVGGSRAKQELEAALRGTPSSYRVGQQTFGTLPEAQAFASSAPAASAPAATPAATPASGPEGENYFDRIARSYTEFARPKVEEQLGKAREQLTFALARGGIMDSSIRSNQSADLQREADEEFQAVADRGREYATKARNSVEDARNNLITTLQVTADNTGATNAALNRAQALTSEPTYSPVGQLFTDFSSGIEQQAALERASALGLGARPRINTGLFGAPNSAVKVSR